ncbi:7621_t:CDS:1, partial [Cetraspora pellucida]
EVVEGKVAEVWFKFGSEIGFSVFWLILGSSWFVLESDIIMLLLSIVEEFDRIWFVSSGSVVSDALTVFLVIVG